MDVFFINILIFNSYDVLYMFRTQRVHLQEDCLPEDEPSASEHVDKVKVTPEQATKAQREGVEV